MENDEEDGEGEVTGRTTPQEPAVKLLPKKRKITGPVAVMAEAVAVLNQLRTSRSAPTSRTSTPQPMVEEYVGDEDLTFAKYLATEIRKVKTPRIKNQLKLKLQSLICDAQSEDYHAFNNTYTSMSRSQPFQRNNSQQSTYRAGSQLWNPFTCDEMDSQYNHCATSSPYQ